MSCVETSSWRQKKSYDWVDIGDVQIFFDLKSQCYKETVGQKGKSEKADWNLAGNAEKTDLKRQVKKKKISFRIKK